MIYDTPIMYTTNFAKSLCFIWIGNNKSQNSQKMALFDCQKVNFLNNSVFVHRKNTVNKTFRKMTPLWWNGAFFLEYTGNIIMKFTNNQHYNHQYWHLIWRLAVVPVFSFAYIQIIDWLQKKMNRKQIILQTSETKK